MTTPGATDPFARAAALRARVELLELSAFLSPRPAGRELCDRLARLVREALVLSGRSGSDGGRSAPRRGVE